MSYPRLLIQSGGDLLFSRLGYPFVDALQQLPAILKFAAKDGRARSRLLPEAYGAGEDCAEKNAEWRRNCTPDLEHLFVSAGEILAGDLAKIHRDPLVPTTWKLLIPRQHHTAWMTSLNAARLALAEIHRITETDMEDSENPTLDPASERHAALITIQLLGYLEELLVEATGY